MIVFLQQPISVYSICCCCLPMQSEHLDPETVYFMVCDVRLNERLGVFNVFYFCCKIIIKWKSFIWIQNHIQY